MIDIHSHVLPGLDDGAESVGESLDMLRRAAEAGTTDLVATPHSNLEYKFDPAVVEERLEVLRNAGGPAPRLHYGCDFHLSYDNIQDAIAHPNKYTINHLCYLLVEFSDLAIFPTTTEIFERLLNAGMIPVITHPERNSLLQRRLPDLAAWAEMGCLVQVTGQSVLGDFGNRAREFSEVLLKHNLVHFIASDAHDPVNRPPILDRAFRNLAKRHGEPLATRLTVDNPRAAIEGRRLPPPAEAEASAPRKWYRFWS